MLTLLLSARLRGLHQNTKIKDIKQFFAPFRIVDVKFYKNGVCRVYFQRPDEYKSALKKKGKIRNKVVRVDEWPTKTDEKSNEKIVQSAPKPSWPSKSSEELKAEIRESGRLFVRNLAYDCDESDLESLFSKFGPLSDIHVAFDLKQQTSKCFAFITFLFPNDAVRAWQELDKTKLKGRLLHILPAEDAPERKSSSKNPDKTETDDGSRSDHILKSEFQMAQHEKLKSSANVAHNWNTLFIRPDAVATYLASKYGLTKEQVLDPVGHGSLAVRLAHGETQLVTEMRAFLEQNGVHLDAFSTSGQRDRLESTAASTSRQLSGTAFLIKNLPVGTTEAELRSLLNRFCRGARTDDQQQSHFKPKRIILPPLGITAIVEFHSPQQARLIYKQLTYEPFQDNILYLQWLPNGALQSFATSGEQGSNDQLSRKSKRKHADLNEAKIQTQEEFELITTPLTEDAIVANTSDAESDTQLTTDHSEPVTKKTRNYQNKKTRLKQQLQGEDQQGEANPIETSNKCRMISSVELTNDPSPSKQKPESAPKIAKPVLVVKNVAFQATEKELTELFKPIGGLVRVRIPQKPAGGHRGFAFVEFSSIDQAKVGRETLGVDTHFLGRKLRIEFAQS